MNTFLELSSRKKFLERKKELLDKIKEYTEGLLEKSSEGDGAVINDILLDFDEKCMAPIVDEISKIEGSSFTEKKAKTTEKKDAKAKKERKPAKKAASKDNKKAKKSTATKSRGTKASNTRKRSC